MNAFFALALLVSPSQAGVVAPIEVGVAPAGPSVTAVPVGASARGLGVAPLFGAGLDLLGGLPLLPLPAPGLVGPALHFVGNSPEAAEVQPVFGAARAQSAPAPASARQGRASDKTPTLPAQSTPGGPSLKISRDRQTLTATLENGSAQAQSEKAAGLGRFFFDQSADKDQVAFTGAAAERPSLFVAATILDGGAFGPRLGGAGRLEPPDAEAALGAGHGPSRDAVFDAPKGEILRDAVASAPGAAAPGGAGMFFRSAAPNGDLAAPSGAPRAAVLTASSAPRPLALDLSRSGLVVRVRSALRGMIVPAQSEVRAFPFAGSGASTALLERGAMFEAFSVAHAYADSAAARSAPVQPLMAAVSRAAAPAVASMPASKSAPAPLWWAWLVLPALAAAAYRAF